MKQLLLLSLLTVIAMKVKGDSGSGMAGPAPVFWPYSAMAPSQIYPSWQPMYQPTPFGLYIPAWNNQPMGSPGLPASG